MTPEADHSEKYVLATIMQNETAYWDVIEVVPYMEMFRLHFHQDMYQAIQDIIEKGGCPDLQTLATKFDLPRLLEFQDMFASRGNVLYHCQEVKKAYIRRELLFLLEDAQERLQEEPDGLVVMQEVFDTFYQMDTTEASEIIAFSDILEKGADYYLTRKKEGVTGYRTGFRELDKLTMGLELHDYWVLLGGPGQGKTALALQIAMNLAKSGVSVGLLPLEGSIEKLGYRFLLNQQSETPEEYTSGLPNTIASMVDYPIHVRNIRQLTDMTYPAAVQQMKRQHDIDVVILDYIQLMSGQGDNRTQQLGNISRAIVDMNNALDIRSLILSQPVKDAYEGRLPVMADVRESGAIAQDATKILGISAASKLKNHALLDDLNSNEIKEKTILNLCKNKEGQTRPLRIHIKPELMKFYDEEYGKEPPF